MRRIAQSCALSGAVFVVGLVLTGCAASDGLAASYGTPGAPVVGNAQYVELTPEQRAAASVFSGPTIDGTTFDSKSLQGSVSVVNFWYAGCAPCRAEAPILSQLSTSMTEVKFLGVNVFDAAAVAQSFDDRFHLSYPSILDLQAGSVQLAFAGYVPPNAVPTTLVLDKQGRIAARISGRIEEASILRAMIEKVEEEG